MFGMPKVKMKSVIMMTPAHAKRLLMDLEGNI